MNAQLEELANLYVLGQLDDRARSAFEIRLVADPELIALVRELESILARQIRSLPRHEPPPDLCARIEERIDRQSGKNDLPVAHPVIWQWSKIARWGIASVVALSLTTLAIQSLRRAPAAPLVVFIGLDSQQSTFSELPLPAYPKDADSRFIQLASLAAKFWKHPDHSPSTPSLADNRGHGYALFDPATGQGFIAIEQLPSPAPAQHYHVWIIDPTLRQVRDAGVLPLVGTQRGLYSFSLGPVNSDPSARLNLFVTVEEDAAPSTQPKGKVVLGDRPI